MKTYTQLFQYVTLSIFLFSCAEMEQHFKDTYCNSEGAYSLGVTDAKNGMDPRINQFSVCGSEISKEAMKGYNKGYSETLKLLNQSNDIEVNVPGIQIRYDHRSKKKYICKVEAFGKSFSAYGPTKEEAREKATMKCQKKYHKMHCDDAKCTLNK